MTRYVLKDGIVLSLDSDVGDFDRADVLVEDDRQRHVRHVMIAGRFRHRNGELVDVDVASLVARIEDAQERALARINGPAAVGALPPGNNSGAAPYRPNRFGSTSYAGQNTAAPPYVLRP